MFCEWEERNRQQEELAGICVSKLKPGTRIVVDTLNSVYELVVMSENRVKVKGGSYFPQEEEQWLIGSTWGGSMLKLHWIGYDMQMEISQGGGYITTSRVRSATVHGDDWQYSLDWPNQIDP